MSDQKHIPIGKNMTIKEVIQLFASHGEKLFTNNNIPINKDTILQLYANQIPVDTPLKIALTDDGKIQNGSQPFFSRILEALPYSLYVVDSKGNPVYANANFINSTGLSKEEVFSKNVFDMVESKIFSPPVTPIVLHERRTVSVNQKLKSGYDTIVTGIPIFNDNKEVEWVVTISQETKPKAYFSVEGEYGVDFENNFVYKSEPMKNIIQIARQVANVDSTVLITGESGVGKDMVARFIHKNSSRADSPFIHLNCGAIPESLLESELFGYEPGAFTGADKKGKKGLIEAAHNGTLFLDEIGEMSLPLQVKFLQVLQKKEIVPIGSTTPIKVNVRVIAATNRNLYEDVQKGKFRLDLYYRLNVIPIHIPPLRERREDILPLSYYFLNKYNKKYHRNYQLTFDIEKELLSSSWPGNIRELENFIERLVVLNQHNDQMPNPFNKSDIEIEEKRKPIEINDLIPLKEAIETVERELIKKAATIEKNSYKIASLLEISQSSAHRKMKKYLNE